MAIHTGVNCVITVSGSTVSGSSGSLIEGTFVFGYERGKFNKVGTDVSEHTKGMKDCSGTLRRKWVSGDTLFEDLAGADADFNVTAQPVAGAATLTMCGCRALPVTRRVAPGTEVLIEEMPFNAIDWAEA